MFPLSSFLLNVTDARRLIVIVAFFAILLSGLGLNAMAASVQDISMQEGADGKLQILVNVEGDARDLAPGEVDAEGVYTLKLKGKAGIGVSDMVMDASGRYIARVNQQGDGLSVIVPGVDAKNVKVVMKTASGVVKQLPQLTSSSRLSSKPAQSLKHVMPAFSLDVASIGSDDSIKTVVAKKVASPSSTAFPKQTSKPTVIPASTDAEQTTSSPDDELLGTEAEALVNQSNDQDTMEWMALSDEGYLPAQPARFNVGYQEAYTRFIELPWQNEQWLEARVESAVAYNAEHDLGGLWWMLAHGVQLLGAMLMIGMLIKFRIPVMQAMTIKAPLFSRKQKVHPTSEAHPNPEKPFAEWLYPNEPLPAYVEEFPEKAPVPQKSNEKEASLDILFAGGNDKSAGVMDQMMTGNNSVFTMPHPTSLEEISPVKEPAVVCENAPEQAASPSRATLKAPSFFAYRQTHRHRSSAMTNQDARSLFANRQMENELNASTASEVQVPKGANSRFNRLRLA